MELARQEQWYGLLQMRECESPCGARSRESNRIEWNRRTVHLKWVKLWHWQSAVACWMDAKKQLLNALKYVSLISRKIAGKIAENGVRAVSSGHNLTTCGRYWSRTWEGNLFNPLWSLGRNCCYLDVVLLLLWPCLTTSSKSCWKMSLLRLKVFVAACVCVCCIMQAGDTQWNQFS